jgi:hypothetical protein
MRFMLPFYIIATIAQPTIATNSLLPPVVEPWREVADSPSPGVRIVCAPRPAPRESDRSPPSSAAVTSGRRPGCAVCGPPFSAQNPANFIF